MKRRPTQLVHRVNLRVVIHEQLDNFRFTLFGGNHQWRLPVLCGTVNVCLGLNEISDDTFASSRGEIQRRSTFPVPGVNGRFLLDQEPNRLLVPIFSDRMQQCISLPPATDPLCPVLDIFSNLPPLIATLRWQQTFENVDSNSRCRLFRFHVSELFEILPLWIQIIFWEKTLESLNAGCILFGFEDFDEEGDG